MRNDTPTHSASLTTGPVERVLRRTATPLVFGLVATVGFQVVDAAILARLGGDALTALGLVTPLQFAVSGVAMGLSVGASSVVARAVGAGATDVGERGRTALGFTALLMASLSAAGIASVEPLLAGLGASEALRPALADYLFPWFAGIAFFSIAIVGNGLLRATGDTRTPARIMVGLAVINALSDPILVLGFGPFAGFGLAGAGWASLIARGAAGLAALRLLSRSGFTPWQTLSLHRARRHLGDVVRLAVPAGAAQMASPLALVLLVAAAVRTDQTLVAAIGTGGRLQSLWLVAAFALGMATSAFVGQNVGANEMERVQRGLRAARRYAVGWGAAGSLVFAVFAEPIAAGFLPIGSGQATLAEFLRWAPLGMAGRAWTSVVVGSLNAAGFARRSAVVAFTQTLGLELPLGLAGLHVLGGTGLFAGLAIANALAGLVSEIGLRPLTRSRRVARSRKEDAMETRTPFFTRRVHAFVGLVAALSLLALPGVAFADGPARVRAERARTETWQDRTRVTGSLRAVSRAHLASQEAGLVVAIHADEGHRVRKGDLLVELDARRLHDALEGARADARLSEALLRERIAEADRAEADRARFEHLFQQKVSSERARTRAVTEAHATAARVTAAERALDAARARVSLLETRFADARVVAPFDGTVVRRGVEPGEWVDPGTSLLTVVSDGALEAWLEVPERHALEWTTADRAVELEVAGQRVTSDALRRVPEVDPRARTYPLVARVPNEAGRFAPGMSVIAWVPKGRAEERVTVPRDAVVRRGDAHIVYRVEPFAGDPASRVAKAVPVSIVGEQGERVAVTGIRSGEPVVVEGNARLADGDAVVSTTASRQVALFEGDEFHGF
ncbi:MAG: efflux RND transporter periplasmic adaptor subunit [Myxococcota bacterium]